MRAYSYAACGEIDSYPHHGLGEYGVNGLRGKTLRVSYRRSSGGWRGGYHNDGKGRLDPMPTDGWYGPVMDLAQQFAADTGVKLQYVGEPDPAYERCFYGDSPCTSCRLGSTRPCDATSSASATLSASAWVAACWSWAATTA